MIPVNKKILNDEKVKDNRKLQVTLYLPKGSINKAEALTNLTDAKSRNAAVEAAIDFYFGYITSELSQNYLCSIYGQQTEATVKSMANRLSRNDFKVAVALDMLTRIVSADLELSKDDYTKLRAKAVEEVKKLNGSIDIYDATLNSGQK